MTALSASFSLKRGLLKALRLPIQLVSTMIMNKSTYGRNPELVSNPFKPGGERCQNLFVKCLSGCKYQRRVSPASQRFWNDLQSGRHRAEKNVFHHGNLFGSAPMSFRAYPCARRESE